MKICTWNLYSKNTLQKEAIKFLLSLGIDFMCLQELRQDTVEYLNQLKGYYFTHAVDHFLNGETIFHGILSSHPRAASKVIHFKTKTKPFLALSYLPRKKACKESIEFLYSDFVILGNPVRVFNVHLASSTGPTHRFLQLKEVLGLLSGGNNIICGDFNSLARIWLNFFIGIFYRYPLSDYFCNELKALTEFILPYDLQCAFKKYITHPISRLHLDHILVPVSWAVKNSIVYKNRYGSDHRLVVVEV